MNRLFRITLVFLTSLSLLSAALADEPYRIVVLPFKDMPSRPGLGIGLATGLQRSLNALDTVYAPAIGDAIMFIKKTVASNLKPSETVSSAFAADAIITGTISENANSGINLTLSATGLQFSEPLEFILTTPATNPSQTLTSLVEQTILSLDLKPSYGDRRDAQRAAEQAPSFTGFADLGFETARLGIGSVDRLEILVNQNPRSSWVFTEYARTLTLAGRLDQATKAAIKATELLPTDVEAWVVRGLSHSATGEARQASYAFSEALRLNPNHAIALVGLANATTEAPEPSTDAYKAAIKSNPRILKAYLGLANSLTDPKRAIQLLLSATNHLPDSAALHREILSRAIALGDTQGAFDYLRQAVTNPLAAYPSTYALVTLLPLKEVQPLIDFLVPGLARFPNDPLILEAAALLDLRNGNPALAERRLRLALAYLPESPSLNNSLAIALAQQEKIQEATEIFQNVANSDARGQLNLAKTFLEGGQAQAALDTLDRYAALETNPAALTMYGIALARLGRANEGEAALERALDLDPQSDTATQALSLIKQQNKITAGQPIQLSAKARIHFDRGMFALEQNRWLDAADAFSVAQEMQPIPILSFYQGYALQLSGRHRDAVESYSTAAETFRESDIVLNNLGYAYLQIGRYDLALINLKKASQLNPSNSSAFLNLGLTQFGLGQYSEALTSWDQAESLNPTLSEGLFNYRIEAEERIRP